MRIFFTMLIAALCVGTTALAQNTKGTGAESKTTTTTNPVGTSISPPPTPRQSQAKAPDKPEDPGNPAATRDSQSLGDPKKGLFTR